MATTFPSFQRLPADVSSQPVPVARASGVLEPDPATRRCWKSLVWTAGLLRPGVRIFAKLECFNPGGSVKDRRRPRKMIEVGLASGALRPGKTIIDSTSGNTGIALAMVGAALGYPVELVMAANVSRERKRIISAFGAKAIYSDPLEGSDGAIVLCRKIIHENSESAISNPTSTTTRPIRWRTSKPPGRKSGGRPPVRLPISSPRWAPAAPLWAPAAI